MGANIDATFDIPDIWFDFYARFVPGSAFAAVVYYMRGGDWATISALQASFLAAGGYCCALTTQWASSEITAWITDRMQQKRGVKIVQDQTLDPKDILGKMHSETTMYIQAFVLGCILFLMHTFPESCGFLPNRTLPWTTLIFVVVYFIAALDFADRRVRRFKRLNKTS
ncbi:MAG: hypothetical protein HYV27_13875 [Candidatus Hydrogenedentes bacterium]|nr:hypothetical protein [Candidatus Hydrogenedentota bacterium]